MSPNGLRDEKRCLAAMAQSVKIGAMTSATDLQPGELAALLHFYADAGVEWLVEEAPVDRFAEFSAQKAARAEARMPASARLPAEQGQVAGEGRGQGAGVAQGQEANRGSEQRAPGSSPRQTASSPQRAPARPASSASAGGTPATMAVPDAEAVAAARLAADSARSLGELKTAMEAFNGCNLKNGARTTVFSSPPGPSGIMVIGPAPSPDDDREGIPFCGRQGQLLDRMLAAIGLSRGDVMLSNVIPWRPPGNRSPSMPEINICRPFIDRQIALAEPKYLLLMGNLPARIFFGDSGSIHDMRGAWRNIEVAGRSLPAIATLHPQDLLLAPGMKALAWQDLLSFKARFAAER